MGMAATLQDYLESRQASYRMIDHPHTGSSLRTAQSAHIPGNQLAKAILLGDDDSYLLVVIPATHRLDLDRLNQMLGRSLVMIGEPEITSTFSDCETGAIPVFGQAYGVDTVIDSGLIHEPQVYFDSGDHQHLVSMPGDDFRQLMEAAPRVHASHHL